MAMSRNFLIGVDGGTESIRAGVLTQQGNRLPMLPRITKQIFLIQAGLNRIHETGGRRYPFQFVKLFRNLESLLNRLLQ